MYQQFKHEDEGPRIKQEADERFPVVADRPTYNEFPQSHTGVYDYNESGNTVERRESEHTLLKDCELEDKEYFCRLCAKTFREPSRPMAHLRGHQENELRMCTLCPESFQSTQDVRRHMLSHSTEQCSDRYEAVPESKPPTLYAHGPVTQSTDFCPCKDNSDVTCTLQDCPTKSLQGKQLNDAEHLNDGSQGTTREAGAAFFDTSLGHAAGTGREGRNRECIEPGTVPLQPEDLDPHQGVFGVVAPSAPSGSPRESPRDHIVHLSAGRRDDDEPGDSPCPYVSSDTYNLRDTARGTRVKEHAPAGPSGSVPMQPRASSQTGSKTPKLLSCPHCGEMFNHKSTFGSHVATHSAAKPFSCAICLRTFPHQNSLNGHYWIHGMEGLVREQNKCARAGQPSRAIDSSAVVQVHQLHNYSEGTDSELDATCPVSAEGAPGEPGEPTLSETAIKDGYAVKKENSLRSHLPAKERKRQPRISPQLVAQVKEVAAVQERNARPRFACHLCPRDFAQRGSLRDHVKGHGGGKPYACHLCPQAFYYLSNLRRHVRRHTGEKGFQCEHCGSKYTRRISLRCHMARAHGLMLPVPTRSANSAP